MKTLQRERGSQFVIVVVALLMSVGCDVVAEGEEGNFDFQYVDSKFTAGASDLAVGSQVQIAVIDAETEAPVEVSDVYSEAPDVIEVVDHQGDRFVLRAHLEESTRITAEAELDGETVTDSTGIRAAEVAEIELQSQCNDALFAPDSRARMRYLMRDAGDTRLTGSGYYPLTIEPEDGGVINEDHGRLAHLVIETGSEPGTYEVSSDLNDETMEFELVDPTDIEVDLSDVDRDGETVAATLDEGETRLVSTFFLERGEEQVCGPATGIVEVTSETPDVCEAEYNLPFGEMSPLQIHAVEVTGLESGDCEVTLAVPAVEFESTIDVTIR